MVSQLWATYKEKKAALRKEIIKSKAMAWKNLLQEVENDPWGKAYKIATKKISARTPLSVNETNQAIKKLFPQKQKVTWNIPVTRNIEPFTVNELKTAASKLRGKKAPGPDGVPSEVIKLAVEVAQDEILDAYNVVFLEGTFPSRWKVGPLVLIPKNEKDVEGKTKVRPICLLDGMGKLYEHLVKDRLIKEIENKGGLSSRQYGFRVGMSTMDALEDVLNFARVANSGTWGRKE